MCTIKPSYLLLFSFGWQMCYIERLNHSFFNKMCHVDEAFYQNMHQVIIILLLLQQKVLYDSSKVDKGQGYSWVSYILDRGCERVWYVLFRTDNEE